jgi:hypothetical protein
VTVLHLNHRKKKNSITQITLLSSMKNDVMREFKRYEGIKTHTWEYMKVNLTHNEGIKTLNNAVKHLKLEEDHIEASKSQETETTVHLTGSISHGGQSQKRKSNDG